jgi:hypothetical protein
VLVERMENKMTKTASRNQVAELGARFLKDTRWGSIDHDALQSQMIDLSSEELGRRFTSFLRNGGQYGIRTSNSNILTIDRSKPFDVKKIMGETCSLLEEDLQAITLSTVDFSEVIFATGLQKDQMTIGEEKLQRLKRSNLVRLDARIGQALFEEKEQMILHLIYDAFGISRMEFSGTVLHREHGGRFLLSLMHNKSFGTWEKSCHFLDCSRDATCPSPLLMSL